jgi:DNA-directed RNA polymerase specialized sigma24 family protein
MSPPELFAAIHSDRRDPASAVVCCQMAEMNQSVESGHEQFRSYLYMLARADLGPRMQNRVDASDPVQQTLLDAHAKKSQFVATQMQSKPPGCEES